MGIPTAEFSECYKCPSRRHLKNGSPSRDGASRGCAIEIPVTAARQPTGWTLAPVDGSVVREFDQRRQLTGGGNLENRATISGPAALGRSVKIAVIPNDQAPKRAPALIRCPIV